MNYIVAALLYNLHPDRYADKTKSFGSKLQDYEEFVFWVFVYIFDELNWRDSYTAEFPKMRNMIISFEKKLDYTFEDVIEHFYE